MRIPVLLFVQFVSFVSLCQPQSIKIGLMVPDSSEANIAAIRVAMDALRIAGKNHEYTLELVVRTCAGPWGMTSKRAVNLIYEHDVAAIISALNSRNAHLVEQVTAKNQVPLVLTRATDPTLTQAYVPWFFRLVPNDEQQARTITAEISQKSMKRIGMYSDSSTDSRMAKQAFDKMLDQIPNGPEVVQLTEENRTDLECLIVCNTALPTDLSATDLPAYQIGSLTGSPKHVKQVFPLDYNDPDYSDFIADAIGLLAQAIEIAGPERSEIQKAIRQTFFSGRTGKIQFDSNGNRIGDYVLK